jgi:mannose-6-phosphate isomerase-like protein (cupin superfamily)
MPPISKYHPLKHYKWGIDCDGWNLVDNNNLSIKQERMPSGASEQLHYHVQAQQFFYILRGQAQFHFEDHIVDVATGEGIHIEPGKKHFIKNNGTEDVEFLLCSNPTTTMDRINCI